MEKLKKESIKVYQEVDKDREMMQLADMLCEESVQMKLSYQLEEKNEAVDKPRNQLETFLGNKQVREKGCGSFHLNDEEITAYFGRTQFASHYNGDKEYDDGEVIQ